MPVIKNPEFKGLADSEIRHRDLAVLLSIATLGLLLRLAPLLCEGSNCFIQNDSPQYVELADGLLTGCGFARRVNGTCATPELLRTPGYPIFLAAMPSLRSAVAIQALLGATTCFIVALFVSRQWGLLAGAAAGVFLAVDVNSIVAGALIQTDALYAALFAAAIILELLAMAKGTAHGRMIVLTFLAALILGVSILVRPIAMVLPPLVAAPFVLSRSCPPSRKIALSLLAFSIPVLIASGWAARNRVRAGLWTISTIGTYNLYYYRAAGVLAYANGGDLDQWQKKLTEQVGAPSGPEGKMSPAMLHEMNQRGYRIIWRHPTAFARMTVEMLIWLAVVPERANLNLLLRTSGAATRFITPLTDLRERIMDLMRSPTLAVLVGFQFAYIVIMWCGVGLALWKSRSASRHDSTVIWFLALVTLLVLAPAAGTEAGARFRAPAMPFIVILAAAGWFAHLGHPLAISSNDQ